MVFMCCRAFFLLQLYTLRCTGSAQTVTCGSVPCGSGSSACVKVQVVRGGVTYSQVLWVNTTTGLSYLPLSQRTVQPFPTVAQLNAGTATAPNSVVYTKQVTSAHVYLIAYSCVHIIISSNGSAAIDTLDGTFAVTNDQTAATYAAGVTAPSVAYAAPYACTGSGAVATLLAGTVATSGYANINLTETAFALASTSCNGVASCTCSGAGNPVCGSFGASTYLGAGVVQYSLSGQAAVLLADGNCGSWVPSSWLVPLSGFVAPTTPACGGIPCGTAGSTCVTVNIYSQPGAQPVLGVGHGYICMRHESIYRRYPSCPGHAQRGDLYADALGGSHWPHLPAVDAADVAAVPHDRCSQCGRGFRAQRRRLHAG